MIARLDIIMSPADDKPYHVCAYNEEGEFIMRNRFVHEWEAVCSARRTQNDWCPMAIINHFLKKEDRELFPGDRFSRMEWRDQMRSDSNE